MSYSNCRFYEEKYPEIDSFVMVNVKQVRMLGAVGSAGARAWADSS
jgi:translation initiation factor 2 subunit 1